MTMPPTAVAVRRDASDAEPTPAKGAWLALGLLSLIYMLNFMDRQILSVLIEPVRKDIAFSDTEIGLLTGTLFALCYSALTVPIAMLADRWNRVRIVAAGCFLWSLFTGLSGTATSFIHLAAARLGVAFGEAGGVAPSLSLLGDLFPPRRRVLAIAIFTCFSPVGVLVGTTAGGLIAAAWGWRAAFLFAAALGIVMTPILLLCVREPLRGRFDRPTVKTQRTSFGETLALFAKLPSLAWLAITCGVYAMVGNGLLTWMPALLMRTHGASVRDVALYYGPMVGISLIVGTILSGVVVTRMESRSIKAYALVPAGAMALCAPLFLFALTSESWQSMLLWLFVPIALMNFVIAPALSLIQHLAPADARSTASALLMLVLNLVGIGLGPLLIGMVSDALAASEGTRSIHIAMMTVIGPLMVATVLLLLMVARHLARDHQRVLDGDV